ncbi:type III pantothenate kinase, partial [bacterium]
MTLLIDIGNTRIKWARLRGSVPGAQKSARLVGDGAAQFRGLLEGAKQGETVLAVNVAGLRAERALRRAARSAGVHAPEFALSERNAAGVRNGYREPWRLGADRWIAVLGARHSLGEHPACVVDVGTALTIDVVDARGLHRGGLIVPGPELMVTALLRGTRGIRRRAAGGTIANAGGPWARTTIDALERGALEAAAGVVERSHAEARPNLRRASAWLRST